MYRLRDFLHSVMGLPSEAVPSDVLYCASTDLEHTFLTNKMQSSLACYTYTLVRQGWLSLVYNGRSMTLRRGDLYIYSPGFQLTVLDGSDDYQSALLMADERMTLESPSIWNMIRTAYYPIAELGQPVVSLSQAQADRLWRRMQEIVEYQESSHRFLDECLRTLYALFVLDLRNMMEQAIGRHQTSERTTELFISFMRLLPRHFAEHHDVGFYADSLFITTTHLSRIVRQITNHTVVDYVNQMLLMEASWLLQTTDLSIAAIAERLHFANPSSFGKFFSRLKGTSPKAYRRQRLMP